MERKYHCKKCNKEIDEGDAHVWYLCPDCRKRFTFVRSHVRIDSNNKRSRTRGYVKAKQYKT